MSFEKVDINFTNIKHQYCFGDFAITNLQTSSFMFGCDNFYFNPSPASFNLTNPFGINNDFGNLNITMTKVPDFTGDFVKNAGILSKDYSSYNNSNWMQNFNYMNFGYSSPWNFQMDTFTKTTTPTKYESKPFSTNIEYKAGRIVIEGYNETKGKELAQKILNNTHYGFNIETRQITSERKNPENFTSNCARYVKRAIEDVGLGKYEDGHACDMIAVLDKNSNFKKISSSGIDVKKLPAGCVLVYGKGVANYSSDYGHIEVTLGDNRAASDGITDNVRQYPTAIYVPV